MQLELSKISIIWRSRGTVPRFTTEEKVSFVLQGLKSAERVASNKHQQGLENSRNLYKVNYIVVVLRRSSCCADLLRHLVLIMMRSFKTCLSLLPRFFVNA